MGDDNKLVLVALFVATIIIFKKMTTISLLLSPIFASSRKKQNG
jgi:hypothetical protein